MKKTVTTVLVACAGALMMSGCLVRTYPLVRERVDQDLNEGNRGFLYGSKIADTDRRTTRTTRVVEMELGKKWQFESRQAVVESGAASAAAEPADNERRFYSAPAEPVSVEPAAQDIAVEEPQQSFQEYIVQKGDTLQKISDRFFGTTKKWHKIYQVNKDVLKGPDKLFAGQRIKIPVEQATAGTRKLK